MPNSSVSGVSIPPDVAAFSDDIYGDVAEWMVDQGYAKSLEAIESITLTVTVGESVTLVDYETRDTIDNVEVDTV